MIDGVSKVVIEVRDQDRAKAFWIDTMGFSLEQDAPYGEERWLEVRSPDGETNLVLELRTEESSEEATIPDHLPTSNVMFRCRDLTRTYEELSARGVRFPQLPVRQPFGWWSMFEDSEGNRFALGKTEDAGVADVEIHEAAPTSS
jgi:lactoylglutathione lyase